MSMSLDKIVDYPTAELLKEKGFDIPVLSCYLKKDKISENYSIINQYEIKYIEDKGNFILIPYNENDKSLYLDKINFNGWGNLTCSAPTIMEVVFWIYEKHGIWISVNEEFRPSIIKDGKNLIYKGELYRLVPHGTGFMTIYTRKTPIEAYQAAIKYCLEKLI